jgi:hypothetical protein
MTNLPFQLKLSLGGFPTGVLRREKRYRSELRPSGTKVESSAKALVNCSKGPVL